LLFAESLELSTAQGDISVRIPKTL
jgi:hypothetical protein